MVIKELSIGAIGQRLNFRFQKEKLHIEDVFAQTYFGQNMISLIILVGLVLMKARYSTLIRV